jgi:hypothetical protein
VLNVMDAGQTLHFEQVCDCVCEGKGGKGVGGRRGTKRVLYMKNARPGPS